MEEPAGKIPRKTEGGDVSAPPPHHSSLSLLAECGQALQTHRQPSKESERKGLLASCPEGSPGAGKEGLSPPPLPAKRGLIFLGLLNRMLHLTEPDWSLAQGIGQKCREGGRGRKE